MADSATKGIIACAIAAVLVLTIIFIALIACPMGKKYSDFLSGMWVGDPTFLQKAGLRDMKLFISPRDDYTGERQGYVIMANENGDIIANQAFDLTAHERKPWAQNFQNHFAVRDKCLFDASFSFDDATINKLIPSDLTISISMANGSLSLSDDAKLYGFLYRDGAASHTAKAAWVDPDDDTSGN